MDLDKKRQHWQAILEQQKQSSLTIAIFCKNSNINVTTFYNWKKRLSQHTSGKSSSSTKHQLVPLIVTDSSISSAPLTLTTPNGYQLAFNEQLSPERLTAFAKALL